ncbi:aldo/keto reductase [Parasedimentitalea psychrophila]|uniref:Aldo/keto reductase n=2 Tax=Parasedimentitalea psychrophila TaxID=2997337 RepID=A0A9Y2L0J3_9RHOB|nr:aldo/keto reductase [Parasedimentitalea psychrophila]WIY25750.1 aldo/keto reductase [Parasedimentitalea psychrophila]
MLTREIGKSGVKASGVGLGTWAIGGWMWGGTDEDASVAAIQASIDAGITLVDTAPAYGMGRSEEIVGKALKGRRDQVVLVSKCGLVWHSQKGNHFFDQQDKPVHRYLGKDSIIYEVEQSLKRLGTDHLDVFITHWQDPTTPIDETLEAMLALKSQGKIRATGASNLSVEDLNAYIAAGQIDCIQEQFSMVHRVIEADLLPICQSNGISVLSYSSLALGLLTGKIGPDRTFEGDDLRKDNPLFSLANRQKITALMDAIAPICAAHNASSAQIIIAWTLQQPGITFSLCGARNPEQAIENADAGRITLSQDDIAQINTAAANHLTNLDG